MKRNILKRISLYILAAVMAVACTVPALAGALNTEKAAGSGEGTDSRDMIDTSRTGSLSIYKYDMTAAEMSGVDLGLLSAASGQSDAGIEKNMYDYAVKGVEFTWLRTGNVETYTLNGDVKVVYELPAELADILGLSAAEAFDAAAVEKGCANDCRHYTSQQVNDAMKALIEADGSGARDRLGSYVKGSSDSVAMALTDEKGHTVQSGMRTGLYLLVETKVPENITDTVNPWFVQLPMTTPDGGEWFYDVTCYPKNQSGNPTLDKLVRQAFDTSTTAETDSGSKAGYGDTITASEGDVLDYLLLSGLPHITSQSTYLTEYVLTDILSEGLTYGRDVEVAVYRSDTDALKKENAIVWWNTTSNAHSEQYADVRVDTNKTGETQMTVTVTDTGLKEINEKYGDCYLAVYYTAELNSDASAVLGDEGNPNDVTLTWARTSEGYYNTLEDRSIVYTYGINLQKNFSDDGGDAEKVQFILYNSSNGYYVVAAQTGINEDGQKVYDVTGRTLKESEATVLSPDTNGALVINGLEADTYTMTEIATDAGYSLLKEPLVIEIGGAGRDIRPAVAGWTGLTGYNYGQENGGTAMYVGELRSGWAKVNGVDAELSRYSVNEGRIQAVDSDHGLVDVTVLNSRGFLLPKTGGRGLYAVTILGVFGVIGGCVLLCRKKKEA